MNLRRLAGLAGVATVALASAAAAEPTRGCFFVRDVGDRTVGGPHTLYFKVKDVSHMHAVAYFHVETKHVCDAVGSDTEHGGFQISSNVLSARHAQMICKADDLVITAGTVCPIATIERMLPQEVAALPRRIRP
ncbi:hypothetical protein [Phenylobacterium sp.]|jgi:hypothetical protein|uniref:hypothetical protein n=1 Tax=Phenylobacterium sp. TaxID=1871053 RepID=UPI002E36341E|nr:hypothetical protein [Phenylobacterium sp.]HEX3367362.1 hypothetical protein [Phenylobacterium sp.]